MSNRISICWKCIHREDCEIFEKNPDSTIIGCGRFIMKDADKAIMQSLHEHFMAEIEDEE